MPMDVNLRLLNGIYKNAQTGVYSMELLLPLVKDDEFEKHLHTQLDEYKRMANISHTIISQNGKNAHGLNSGDKLKLRFGVYAKTAMDKSTSHISEMLILGSSMGVIDAIKKNKKYHGADKEILKLSDELRKVEEINITQLKKFLQ